ncbi:hypothetical protein [Sphingobacterium chuzhouense]|uniref:DUF3251 domain-containing protein n=1 Tax=Sphingobacterium chuzhouense TaxID=1742264 RepID=A0ABR7XN67_9SPHI|nr:hypothetical protein [Sphingobacterium chuzhouense]MBD1420616.1 hypothetical protein [Sphingobacterium chuzhouense]
MKNQRITLLFFIALSLICRIGFAQTNSLEQLQSEITSLKRQLADEKEKVAYFKDALDLRNSELEITQDSVTIKLTEVKGNSSEKTISIKGLVIYHGDTEKRFQFYHEQQFVDPNGNIIDQQFNIVRANDPTKRLMAIEDLEKDIPYAFLMKFENCSEKIPTISLLRIEAFSNPLKSRLNYKFKGVDVAWD